MQTVAQHSSSFEAVIYGVFQKPQLAAKGRGISVALAAAHPQAGTTYLTKVLTEALNGEENSRVIAMDSRELAQTADAEPSISSARAVSTTRGSWRTSRDYRANYLNQLKDRYGSVLIDCPSLKESKDILALAPLVDGIFLVIEANKTTKSQIAFLERMIAQAGGKSLGHLLNKRTYPIPAWAYNFLGF